eukprot:gene3389-2343_t
MQIQNPFPQQTKTPTHHLPTSLPTANQQSLKFIESLKSRNALPHPQTT